MCACVFVCVCVSDCMYRCEGIYGSGLGAKQGSFIDKVAAFCLVCDEKDVAKYQVMHAVQCHSSAQIVHTFCQSDLLSLPDNF